MILINETSPTEIVVAGIGGAGTNAINRMIRSGLGGVNFVTMNTDLQSLKGSYADIKIRLGYQITRGLGTGGKPEIGERSAITELEAIKSVFEGAEIAFLAAGMGGGTGTGATPVIANLLKEMGILTIAVVTRPFTFEGYKRKMVAEWGIKQLKSVCHTLLVISNQALVDKIEGELTVIKAFEMADEILLKGVQGISDLITKPGLINLDFADLKTVLTKEGMAILGLGKGKGKEGALLAVKRAITSPLIEDSSIEGATDILINYSGGKNMRLKEIQRATEFLADYVSEEANIFFGTTFIDIPEDEIQVTIIAKGGRKPTQILKNLLIKEENKKEDFDYLNANFNLELTESQIDNLMVPAILRKKLKEQKQKLVQY